jgi:hypothetical protein
MPVFAAAVTDASDTMAKPSNACLLSLTWFKETSLIVCHKMLDVMNFKCFSSEIIFHL